jgi:hypothetical protein
VPVDLVVRLEPAARAVEVVGADRHAMDGGAMPARDGHAGPPFGCRGVVNHIPLVAEQGDQVVGLGAHLLKGQDVDAATCEPPVHAASESSADSVDVGRRDAEGARWHACQRS